MTLENKQQCGHVAIIGRPNVGKSTLLNCILGQKISIVTRKPQTTREQILGIKTTGAVQAIYIDTPGMHKNYLKQRINRLMNRAATAALASADIIIFIIAALKWEEEDQWVLEKLAPISCPVILAINKSDLVKNKSNLLPFIAAQSSKYTFTDIFPIAAKNGHNVPELEAKIAELLPFTAHQFGPEEITNRSMRFITTEIIREKVMRLTGNEVPYAVEIEIESYVNEAKLTRINAVIYLDKLSQKAIIIGAQGGLLKAIGTQARLDIEALIGRKVFLGLFVKVKRGQADRKFL